MSSNKKYFAVSFMWSFIAKLIDALIKFFTIPLLLKYFGVNDYGILTLAIATNAYINLVEMGVNTGSIKYISQWLGEGKYDLVDRVARTNITFYIIIAFVNILILVLFFNFGGSLFNIHVEDFVILQQLFVVLMCVSIFSWANFAFSQLIIANQKIKFTYQFTSIRSIINLLLVLATIHFKLTLTQYYIFYTIISALLIIPNIILCLKDHLISKLRLGFYWNEFSVIFKYSLSIFAMGFFQMTASQSKPILLGIFTTTGASILSEYKIIEVVPTFISSILGMLLAIILPKASQNIGNNKSNDSIAYQGTAFTTVLLCLLAFPFLLCGEEFLEIYVGEEFVYLLPWYNTWIVSLFIYLYNAPISALVLAKGKTKPLVYSSAIACVVSLITNALLCQYYGVGSAVIGYIIFVVIIMAFYYLYFIENILNLNSFRIFYNFALPFFVGIMSFFICYFIDIDLINNIYTIVAKSAVFILLFLFFILIMCKCRKIFNINL